MFIIMNITNAYEVPLKTQVNNSCATTSLMMAMETWNESHSQEWWDMCAKRSPNGFTYLTNIELCVYNLGYTFQILDSSYANSLKSKDLVIYHVLGYDNKTDLHVSVIESINTTNKSMMLANPWGRYDFYTFKEFEKIYDGRGIRIKSFNKGIIDIDFIKSIDETKQRKVIENKDNECLRIYKERQNIEIKHKEIKQELKQEEPQIDRKEELLKKARELIIKFNQNRSGYRYYGCG